MRPREMELFVAISRSGSVTAGAAAVGMSQPAASAMLRGAESRLGFELFSRRQRRLELTSNGRALLPEMVAALAALDSVEQLAESMGRKRPGRLVVGAISAAGATLLPQALRAFKQQYPTVPVALRNGFAVDIIEWAAHERVDIGIVLGGGHNQHVGSRRLANLALACAMPRRHALARSRRVTPEQLAATPFVGHSRQLPIGALTAAALEARGLRYQPSIEVGQFSAACAFAESGCGVAVLDSLTARHAARLGLTIRPFDAPSDLSLDLVWPLARGLGPLAATLARHLESGVEALD